MHYLFELLDKEDASWKADTIIQLDNATYHKSRATREFFRMNQVRVIFSGPYAYSGAPCELWFSALKRVNLSCQN
jgi:transposase